MNELDRLRMAWVQAVWDGDYKLAAKITDDIQACIANDWLVQELWPGARIMAVGEEVGEHE